MRVSATYAERADTGATRYPVSIPATQTRSHVKGTGVQIDRRIRGGVMERWRNGLIFESENGLDQASNASRAREMAEVRFGGSNCAKTPPRCRLSKNLCQRRQLNRIA